jgi:hypothetical protein
MPSLCIPTTRVLPIPSGLDHRPVIRSPPSDSVKVPDIVSRRPGTTLPRQGEG